MKVSLLNTVPRHGGFSFIELIISAAILAALASIAMPLAETTVKRRKENDLRRALAEIRNGIDAYKQASAAGRIIVEKGQSGYPPTLTDLAAGVPDVKQTNSPLMYFLRRVPRDPFHPDKKTSAIDTWGKRSFSSSAESPQEGEDVYDVFSLSDKTAMDGSRYAEW